MFLIKFQCITKGTLLFWFNFNIALVPFDAVLQLIFFQDCRQLFNRIMQVCAVLVPGALEIMKKIALTTKLNVYLLSYLRDF